MNGFDRLFRQRLWNLIKPYWASDQKWAALGLAILIILLSAALKGSSVVFSYVNRDLMTALSERDQRTFFNKLLLVAIYNLVAAPLTALGGYLSGKLMINWRQWLTEHFLDRGFRQRAFYRISSDPRIDNPDQRISEDLNTFVGFSVSFVIQVLEGLATGAAFLIVLWLISPTLVGVLTACVVAGSLLTIVIGRPLIEINFEQRRREADFRYALVGLRNNAEAIALYGGERREQVGLVQRLYALVQNFNRLIEWQRNLAFFTYAYDLLLPLVPFVLLAPGFFAGRVEFGKITQASGAFIVLRTSLSIIVDQFNGLSAYAAGVERLRVYREACERAPVPQTTGTPAGVGEPCGEIETIEAPRIAAKAFTLKTPNLRQTLIREMSFEVASGERLLIAGQSGAGKTSMLRAIAGLWRSGSGRIVRPPLSEIMILPQRPYMIIGSLREQLCYPRASGISDVKLLAVLRTVNLEDLAERIGGLDVEVKWQDLLSLGEQQKIAFARLLLNHPAYAFLDEATSALDPANEEELYDCLISAGINVVSAGDRVRLAKYHHKLLELLGGGNWRISPSAQ